MNKKPTTRVELIAKYGLEWYENHHVFRTKEQRERHNAATKRWLEKHPEKAHREGYKEKHNKASQKWFKNNSALAMSRVKTHRKERFDTDPVFKATFTLTALFNSKRSYSKIVTPEEAERLLKEEAEKEHFLEMLDINFIKERIKQNNEFNLAYGNAQILKFFYKMMQIKVAKGENFTEDELEIIRFFRTANFDGVKGPYFNFENPWILYVINIDMAYIEDMMRNAKHKDLIISEEDYLEKKGLTSLK